jgi:hypothetical protein
MNISISNVKSAILIESLASTLNTLHDRLGLFHARGIIMPSNSNGETQAQRVDTMRHAFK